MANIHKTVYMKDKAFGKEKLQRAVKITYLDLPAVLPEECFGVVDNFPVQQVVPMYVALHMYASRLNNNA
eukprot:15364999-Ditylum_brightwellii.AAC.1